MVGKETRGDANQTRQPHDFPGLCDSIRAAIEPHGCEAWRWLMDGASMEWRLAVGQCFVKRGPNSSANPVCSRYRVIIQSAMGQLAAAEQVRLYRCTAPAIHILIYVSACACACTHACACKCASVCEHLSACAYMNVLL